MFCVFQLKFQHLDVISVNPVSYSPVPPYLVEFGRCGSFPVMFGLSLGPVDSTDVPFSNLIMPNHVDQPILWIAFGE